MEKIETIFDHNVTDEELQRFGGKEYFEMAKKYGVDPYKYEDDSNYAIGLLYSMRGDKKRAKEYLDKVKSRDLLQVMVQDCL